MTVPSASPRRSAQLFAGAALAVGAARLLVALSRADEFRGEELWIGSFARALLLGVDLDPAHLPIIVHLRGSVVFGLLAVPLSALLGPLLWVQKTLALAWSAATAGLLALAFDRGAGRRAAWVATFLIALLPPSFQRVDVLALGSHGDVLLFVAASLVLVLGARGPLGRGRAAALGAVVGLGALFSLQYLVALPALALAWWRVDQRFWRRSSAAAFALVAVAAAAPIPFLSRSATLVQTPIADHVLPRGLSGAAHKLARTLAHDLADSWLFDERVATLAYAAGLVLALVLAWPRLRRAEPLALFALVYPALVLALYAASDFELNLFERKSGMGSRYLMPILPFLAGWAALATAQRHRWSSLPAWALAAAGLFGWARDLDPGLPWRLPPLRGTNYPFFTTHLEHAAGRDFAARRELARRLDPDWEASRVLRYGDLHPRADEEVLGSVVSFERLRAERAQAPPDERPWLGVLLGRRLGRRADPGLANRVLSAESDAWVQSGLGIGLMEKGLGELVATRWRRCRAFAHLNALDASAAAVACAAAGFHAGQVYTPYNANYGELLRRSAELTPERAEPWFRGLALGWRTRFVEADWRVPAPGAAHIERALPERGRAAFRAGLSVPTSELGLWP